MSEQSDQLTYSFLFIITPLDIISTKSVKNLKKSILLKLGNRTEKTSQLNKAIHMPVEVLYSKTLKKYCPIKGIIKIYDINLDGSEVISSVGGFQTEQILNEQKKNITIERDVGTSKLKMKIEIQNLGILKGKPQPQKSTKKQDTKVFVSRSRTSQSTVSMEPVHCSTNATKNSLISRNTKQQTLQQQDKKNSYYFKRTSGLPSSTVQAPSLNQIELKKKSSEVPKNQTSAKNSCIQKIQTWSRASNNDSSQAFQSQFSQTYLRQKQNEQLGQHLLEQRRKNVQLEQKIQSYDRKTNVLKKVSEFERQRDATLFHFQKISDGLEVRNGKIWIELNQKQKSLSLKYKNKNFEKVFGDFIEFMVVQLKRSAVKMTHLEEDCQGIKKSSLRIGEKAQIQFKMLNDELSKKTHELFALRTKQRQRASLQIKSKSKQRQCFDLQNRLKESQILKKSLKQENTYLKQKDETMQQIISEKQNQIQALKQQITQIELEYKQIESTLKNDTCEIQELKEEVSNLNQTIQTYREKYGDLKNVKNRALQNQLKECLMWIDQQTRELEMSDYAEETEPSHSHNVSEIIKNIELQGTSREEMNSIKHQLSGLIKRIDNFLAK